MENLSKYLPTIIIFFVILIVVLCFISYVKKAIRRLKYKAKNMLNVNNIGKMVGLNQYGLNTSDLLNAMNDARTTPEIKSVGGMTSIYLPKIQKDFPNYHNNEIENIIKNVVREYIEILYDSRTTFSGNVSDRFVVDNKKVGQSFSNLKFNGIAIYNYIKASDYATVVYRCSVGYDIGGNREETRYEVDYSYELVSENNENMGLLCPVCGGRYDSIKDTKCPYCGALVVKDTYMNWFITNIKEI